MKKDVTFTLDGATVTAAPDESIWQVAARHGTEIPHLCHTAAPGYRADGNCRACMVEIEGERVLAASCIRKPASGMVVRTASDRAKASRKMVFEMLLADQPARKKARDPESRFWDWTDRIGLTISRLPERETPTPDISHPAMAVHLDACIHCNLCVRACREVQVNDVIGMALRGNRSKIVFDMGDPMGVSTCVACGECVQACPTGALMPANLLDEDGIRNEFANETVDSVCPYCGVGCQITYNLKDGKLLHVEGRDGPANEQRLCVKGRFGFDYAHSPQRLTKPLIRKDDAPKSADILMDPMRPLDYFYEATWEEALERATSGLKAIRAEKGPKALAGFGSAKGSNEEAYLFQKLVRTGFGSNNVDHCTRLCHATSVSALNEGIGSSAVTAPFTACLESDVIFVIGANPAENHPVAATYFKQAAKNGATLIVADPRGQALERHAAHMLRFKGGTDVAMLNALLNVIVEEKLYDEQYVQTHTEGFAAFVDHIRKFAPEEMAPICGISADELRTVARKFATAKKAIIFWGMGISQHIHGTDNSRCLIALSLISGHMGRPGTGLHPLRGQNNVQGASDAGLIPMFLPDYQPVDNADLRAPIEDLWGGALDPNRGLTVVEIINAILTGEINGMYIMGENPAMSDPDTAHARAALASLDHLVVQDIFLTETAWHADVVLPASAWPEKTGTVTNTNRQVQMGRQALALPGDTHHDLWIIQEMARGMGLDWAYQGPVDVFSEMAQVMPSLDNISWDRLERENAVTYPCNAPDKPGSDIVFGDGFPTASGRARLVAATPQPPGEVPDDEYPMILTTGRQLEHWHTGTMTHRASILSTLEPEAVASLNPTDIQRIGIAPGDPIRVETRRGSIELTARMDTAVPVGAVFIPFCYTSAPTNMLTHSQIDPWGKTPEFKFCAARVEKAEVSLTSGE